VCALRTDQELSCWGSASAATAGLAPSSWSGLPPVASIETGRIDVCVTTTDGDGYCWGFNQYGQVGDGTNVVQTAPTLVIDSP
jgi:alpha-tubulin suppressor-like RCC1 family protein